MNSFCCGYAFGFVSLAMLAWVIRAASRRENRLLRELLEVVGAMALGAVAAYLLYNGWLADSPDWLLGS